MRGGAECQEVEDHRLVVAAPVVGEKPCPRFRVPAERHAWRAWREPLPVGATIDGIGQPADRGLARIDRKSTRLNSSHTVISYAVFCLKKKNSPSRTTSASATSR